MKKILFAFLMFIITAPAWCITISGTVTDTAGAALQGVSVYPSNNKTEAYYTETNEDGKFSIKNVTSGTKITISIVGCKAQETTATEAPINIKLDCTNELDAITVSTNARNCTKEELQAQDSNAVTGTLIGKENDKVTCKITKCKSGYEPDKKGEKCISTNCDCGNEWNNQVKKCESWKDTTCTAKNAKSAERRCVDGKEKCVITECNNEYHLDADKNECIYNRGQSCTSTDPNATSASFHRVNGKLECVADSCDAGFDLIDGKCVAREIATDEEIEELEKNADAMEDKKNSLANRMIGAAGMGATGIGGMMALSAMSEQRADDSAERDMRAYLETFHCNYGSGPNVRGGTTGVELPGGNDMIGLYTQYATLANDLKIRKNALGLKPGVESEIVIDKASTGLYDNTSTGITKGAYASIARAIADPDGEDAKIWNDQKKKTSKNLKTGAIVAGVGAAGSLAANLAVNSGNKDQTKNILDKYKDSRTTKDTNSDMSKLLEQPTATLAGGADTEIPTGQSQNETDEAQTVTCNEGEGLIDGKCAKCGDKNLAYDAETKTCLSCGENQEIKEGKCVDKNTPKPQNTTASTEAPLTNSPSNKKYSDQNVDTNSAHARFLRAPKTDFTALSTDTKQYVNDILNSDITDKQVEKIQQFIKSFDEKNVYFEQILKEENIVVSLIDKTQNVSDAEFKRRRNASQDKLQAETNMERACKSYNTSLCGDNTCEIIYFGHNESETVAQSTGLDPKLRYFGCRMTLK